MSRDPDVLNPFALALLRQLAGERDFFYGPLSVVAALGMLWSGAEDESAAEIGALLGLEPDQQAALAATLRAFHGESLRLANRLWTGQSWPVHGLYVERLAADFGADHEQLDFADAEGVAERINGWVEERSEGLIPRLIEPGMVSADMALVLTNVVTFIGRWETPFESHATSEGSFYGEGGWHSRLPFMQRLGELRYAADDEAELVELPYRDEGLVMWLLKPKNGDAELSGPSSWQRIAGKTRPAPVCALSQLRAGLTVERFAALRAGLASRRVSLALPRFTLRHGRDLTQALQDAGIRRVFSRDSAQLGGITEVDPCWVGSVVHEAVIQVDEEGTKAAAATAMALRAAGIQSFTPFRCDHPFLFFIGRRDSGQIVFAGQLMTPGEAAEERPPEALPSPEDALPKPVPWWKRPWSW